MEVRQWSYEDFPEFDEPVDGAVTVETDGNEPGSLYTGAQVTYLVKDGTPLHLEILTPVSRNRKKERVPCIVFVQGSAWMKQETWIQIPLLGRLAERGYVVAAAEYRHSGIAPFPAQAVDARNAVRFLRLHAAEYGIDPERMVLAGDSSGGHTAVFGGLRHNDETEENAFPGLSGEVKGILDYYGSVSVLFEDANPTTVNHKLPDSPEGMVMGGVNLRERPELCEELSAQCHICPDTQIAPMLILHGTKDRIVNARQSAELYRRLKSCGKDAQLILLRGADHGGPEFWTTQVLDMVEDFIQRCFRTQEMSEREKETAPLKKKNSTDH